MSLQVWLPLNGNLNNQGLFQLPSSTINTISYTDNGKIGKASSGYCVYHLSSEIVQNSWSLACWCNSSAWVQYNNILLCNNVKSSEDCRFYFSIINGTSLNIGINGPSSTASVGFQFSTDTWYHVAATYDGTNYALYINGDQVKSGQCTTAMVNGKLNLGIGARSADENGTNAAINSTVKLNDVRIYDHALSVKEIKEISKALVVHYPMNDEYIESTTNINYFIEQGISNDCYNAVTGNYSYGTNTDIYKTTGYFKDKQCTKVYMGTADQEAFPYVFFKNIHPSNGSYKTLSFDYYPTSQNQINFYTYNGPANLTSTVNGTVIDAATMTVNLNEWNHITVTLYGTSDATNGWGYMKIGTTRHTSTTTDYWLFANVQIEEKDHATPYTDSSRNETIIYDCSGFTNNGTIKSNPVCSSNSPRYEKCYDFTNDKKILISNLPTSGLANSYTLSWWSNVASYSDRMCWGFANGNRLNYFNGYYCNTGDGYSNPFKIPNTTTTISQPSGDVWHHFAMVGNGTDVRLYMDGDLYGIATTYKPVTGSSIYINGWNSASDYDFNGKMSDFRIYSTALSAEDIKELYNAPISISKNGRLFTQGEVIEK